MLNDYYLICIISLLPLNLSAQITQNVYLVHGQGSDKRIFDSLKLDPSFGVKYIEYGTPAPNQTLKQFAHSLSTQVDTTKPFSLIGHSLGGMICAELNEIMFPEKVIIVSGAENRNELPWRYRFQRYVPLYALFPANFLLFGAKILQPVVEPDRNKFRETFKSMLNAKSGKYMKRSISMIIKWDRITNSKKNYKVHGTNDHTLPLKNIRNPDYIIENGSHMMTLTRAGEVSFLINKILME